MKIQSLLQIDDLRNLIKEYFNFDLISLGNILNVNFLIYHNFNVDFCTILDISRIKTTREDIILRMGEKLTSQDLYYKYRRLINTNNTKFFLGFMINEQEREKHNLFALIENSISFIFARKAVELLELNKIDINYNVSDLEIIDNEVLKYYEMVFDSDVNKKEFCQRCGLFGHTNVSIDQCGLYDRIYSRKSYDSISCLNESIELKKTSKMNSFDTLRLNNFIAATEEKKINELQKASELFSKYQEDQNFKVLTEYYALLEGKTLVSNDEIMSFEYPKTKQEASELFSKNQEDQNLKLSKELNLQSYKTIVGFNFDHLKKNFSHYGSIFKYYTWFNIPRNIGRFVNNNLEILSSADHL
jgi:ribosomal protein S27AE